MGLGEDLAGVAQRRVERRLAIMARFAAERFSSATVLAASTGLAVTSASLPVRCPAQRVDDVLLVSDDVADREGAILVGVAGFLLRLDGEPFDDVDVRDLGEALRGLVGPMAGGTVPAWPSPISPS
jgi:hypothetical protein